MEKIIILFLIVFVQSAYSSEISEKIMSLREEVQSVSDEISTLSDHLKSRAQTLAIKKGELSAQYDLLNEETRILEKTFEQKKEISGDGPVEIKGLGQVVKNGVDELVNYVEVAVPFKVKERRKAAETLITKYEKGDYTQEKFLEKFWSLLQDELRFSSDVELQQQTIVLQKKKKMVEIIRVGMTALFFRSLDGDVGRAVQKANSWHFETFKTTKEKSEVLKLFNAKKKMIEGEVYDLPLYVKNFDEAPVSVSMKEGEK